MIARWSSAPVVVPRSGHCISRRDIDPDALKVMRRLNRCGHKAYLVGGGVRDLLLGRTPKDFDISTDAHPNRIKKLFRNCFLIGRRFRLAHIRFGDKVIETSTFRRKPEPVDATDEEEKVLYQHRDNTFGTPEEDAKRRDFTVNGLFYDLATFDLIDHVGGLKDLKRKVIRAIGDPDVRFREDPVRMLRAIRFASRLGFSIERRTLRALKKHAAEITRASAPRLYEEIGRLFAYRSGAGAFRLLFDTGMMAYLLPELDDFVRKGGGGAYTLWDYLAALDRCEAAGDTPSPTLALATLFYAPFRAALEEASRDGDDVVPQFVARDLLGPVAARFGIPRWQTYRVIRLLDSQRRFEGWRKGRFSKRRFVAHEGFAEAATLYELHLEVIGREVTSFPWRELERQVAGEQRKDDNRERKPERSRRGRGGRPPRRRGRRRWDGGGPPTSSAYPETRRR